MYWDRRLRSNDSVSPWTWVSFSWRCLSWCMDLSQLEKHLCPPGRPLLCICVLTTAKSHVGCLRVRPAQRRVCWTSLGPSESLNMKSPRRAAPAPRLWDCLDTNRKTQSRLFAQSNYVVFDGAECVRKRLSCARVPPCTLVGSLTNLTFVLVICLSNE